jgi:hypothetical protein
MSPCSEYGSGPPTITQCNLQAETTICGLDNKMEIDSEQVVYSTTVEMLLWGVKKRSCDV